MADRYHNLRILNATLDLPKVVTRRSTINGVRTGRPKLFSPSQLPVRRQPESDFAAPQCQFRTL
jgi:hypothetical protein